MAQTRSAWAMKTKKEKTRIHNLPYGPRTRLIRGISSLVETLHNLKFELGYCGSNGQSGGMANLLEYVSTKMHLSCESLQ